MYLCSNTSTIDFNVNSQVFNFADLACSVIEELAFFGSSSGTQIAAGFAGFSANPDRLQMALVQEQIAREKTRTEV